MDQVQATLDLGARAKEEYKYTFREMDASTEEEQITATWCLNAYQKYHSGDYASAVKMFGSAASIAPKMPTVYRNWARMEIEAGFYARAKECISKAVDLASDDVRMRHEWGSIEMKAQHYDETATKVEHALQMEPDNAQLLNLLGEIEKRRGNHSPADSLFRRALARFEALNETSHLKITRKAMADNLRKWAEALMSSDAGTATSYLNRGYGIMTEAVLRDSSPRAQATLGRSRLPLADFATTGAG
jgi:tetratricopeptide (TPR) repeat protein